MSDKFLNTGGSNTNITNGTATLFGSTIGAINLDPSQPIKTNSVRQLVSSKLDIADITNLRSELNQTIKTPYIGSIRATDYETDNYLSVNSELQKIDNLTVSTQAPNITNISGLTKSTELATGRLYDTSETVYVNLNTTNVDVSATNFTFNGNNVLTDNTTVYLKVDGSNNMTNRLQIKANSYSNTINITDQNNTAQNNAIGYIDIGGVVGGTNFIMGYAGDTNFCRITSYSNLNDIRIGVNGSFGEKYVTLKVDGTFEINSGNLNMKANNIITSGLIDGVDIGTRDSISVINNGASTQYAIPKFSDNLGKTIQNSSVLINTNSQIILPSGSISLPSISFTGNTNTGLYSPNTNQLGLSVGNSEKILITSSKTSLKTTDITLSSFGAGTLQTSSIGDISVSQHTTSVYRISPNTTGTVYDDGTIRFLWDGTNKQPQYNVIINPSGGWVDVCLQLTKGGVMTYSNDDNSSTSGVNYYFTTDGIFNAAFNFISYGTLATTWIVSEFDLTYPSYKVEWICGGVTTNLTVVVHKYFN